MSEKAVRQLFAKLDTSGDGSLSGQELDAFMQKFRPGITQAQIAEYLVSIDKDGDKKVNFDEFYVLFGKKDIKKVSVDDFRALFNKYDKDHSGFLETAEAEVILTGIEGFTEDRVIEEVEKFDANKDGKISLDEFIKICQNSK